MNKKLFACCTAAFGSGLSLLMIGCEGEVHTRTAYVEHDDRPVVVQHDVVHDDRPVVVQRDVIVEQAPPAPRYEAAPPPRAGYVWIPGYYRYDNRQYIWVEGRFERPPREGVRWEAGHWDHRGNGYVWIEGGWR